MHVCPRSQLHLLLLLVAASAAGADNLIRNGSFEGSLQYWPEAGTLVHDDTAPSGSWCMRLDDKQSLRSMPFTVQPGRRLTIACFAKAASPGEVAINPMPSNREIGQGSHWAWNAGHTFRAHVGTSWSRVAIQVDIPALDAKGGFAGSDHTWWNLTSWIFMLNGPHPLWVDGITVAYDDAGAADYLAQAPLEVTTTVLDLPGYQTPSANLVDPALPLTVRSAVFNPGPAALDAVLRLEQLDYRGEHRFGDALEAPLHLEPGHSLVLDRPLTVLGRGLELVRSSVLIAGKLVASGDQPVTALAFPAHATVPDPRERFGASVFGPRMTDAAQAIGLAYTRWYPQMNWAEAQPKTADAFSWQTMDQACAVLWARGITPMAVLHSIPDWAKGGANQTLPKDMQWAAGDTHWDDAALVTSWDRFVEAIAQHYLGKALVYEFANEPDIGAGWDRAIYARLAIRTARLLKRTDPKAVLMVNQTWPGVNDWGRDVARLGVYAACPVHTFHNYTPGELCGVDAVNELTRLFTSFGAPHTTVWFDEGWIFNPSSLDYPARELIEQSPSTVADLTTRTAANLLAGGLERFIPFFIGYEEHGRSYWDWVGSGTEWWDDHGNPTVAVGVYNVLCHFLGRSHPVARIPTAGALVQVFQDERRGAGVAVAWADAQSATLALVLPGVQLLDCMGNACAQETGIIALHGAGRPYWLVAPAGCSGEHLAELLAPLALAPAKELGPPAGWSGSTPGTPAGNPRSVPGVGAWRVDQVWPDEPLEAANYRLLPWNGTEWQATENAFGGQPAADTAKQAVRLSCRAVWSGSPGEKLCALSFVAPSPGRYQLRAHPSLSLWEGKGATAELRLIRLPASGRGEQLQALAVADGVSAELRADAITLSAGDRLVLVPHFRAWHVAGTFELRDLSVVRE